MIPKEAPWKTSALNEQFRKKRNSEFSVRYVWNGAGARLRWNIPFPQRDFVFSCEHKNYLDRND